MAGISLTERDTALLREIIGGLARIEQQPIPRQALASLAKLLDISGVSLGAELSERERFLFQLLRPHVEECYVRWQRQHPAVGDLTPRQLAVLELVRDGYTNGQIGRLLQVSEGTVRTHLNNIYERLGVQSRTAAVTAVYGDGG